MPSGLQLYQKRLQHRCEYCEIPMRTKFAKHLQTAASVHAKVWKVFLQNIATWKIKSSASSLNLRAPKKLAQTTVLEANEMNQKSSMAD